VACLYCGKEIGPFQLFRDGDFCSPAHRKRYAERLGKVIGRISEAEPTPTKTAGFRADVSPFPGNQNPVLKTWMPIPLSRAAPAAPRFPISWPFEITPLLGTGFALHSGPASSPHISHSGHNYSA